ncbi:MAG: hypothetical protein OXC68_11515 [Aestuariivita sp.]|nr:hypothetical protein [Aestuariivita sp.]
MRFDQEFLIKGMMVAGFHIEAGTRKFEDYSKVMIDELGEAIKPYLRSFYESVRFYPGFDNEDMSTSEEINVFLRGETDSQTKNVRYETASDMFPLDDDELSEIQTIITTIKNNAPFSSMTPRVLLSTSVLLLALNRMPKITPGIDLMLTCSTPNNDGNWGWVDLAITDSEFRLGLGEHFYDSAVGGDTESFTNFEAYVGDDHARGSVYAFFSWTEQLSYFINQCFSMDYDESDYEHILDYFEDLLPD